MAQIWLRHDQDLCVSSIWPGDGVLGTLVTNWAQPRSFSPSFISEKPLTKFEQDLSHLRKKISVATILDALSKF